MVKDDRCFVCNQPAEIWRWQSHHGHEVECNYCGNYRISNLAETAMRTQWETGEIDPLLWYLPAAIRQAAEPPIVSIDSWKELAQARAERPADEKRKTVLQLLKQRSRFPGEFVAFEHEKDKPLVDAGRDEEADFLLRSLKEAELIEGNYPLFTVTPKGWEYGQTHAPSSALRNVFLSHGSADALLAASVAEEIRKRLPSTDVFVSSQPGQIRTGEKWLEAVEHRLRTDDAYVILMTPTSIERRWVWFETGSVWFSGKRVLPVTAAGLDEGKIPHPISALQALNLDKPAHVKVLFRELGADILDDEADEIAATLRVLSSAPSSPWSAFSYENRTFAWDGPVASLQDWSPVVATKSLMAFIEGHGFKSRCARSNMIGRHAEKGYRQVFESDLAGWKRPVMCPDNPEHFWIVRPLSTSAADE